MAGDDDSAADLPRLKQAVSASMVFPPANHENLQPLSRLCKVEEYDGEVEEEAEEQHTPSSFSPPFSIASSSSSTSSFPSSEEDPEVIPDVTRTVDPPARVREVACDGGWSGFRFRVLRGIFAWLQCGGNVARGTAFWSFAPAAAAVLWLFYRRWQFRRWQNLRLRREQRLLELVKQKDEKISRLLNQIVQMNELLISRRRLSS